MQFRFSEGGRRSASASPTLCRRVVLAVMCPPENFTDAVDPTKHLLSGCEYDAQVLSKEDEWIAKVDHAAFKEDVRKLGKALHDQQGEADLAHLRKIIRWQRFCVWFGCLTMWYCVNPISIYLISIGTMARWTIIAHHVCHGGFDNCKDREFNRFKFGVGNLYRRCADWLDWMLVEAWNVEHNQLHHYCLGEVRAPHAPLYSLSHALPR